MFRPGAGTSLGGKGLNLFEIEKLYGKSTVDPVRKKLGRDAWEKGEHVDPGHYYSKTITNDNARAKIGHARSGKKSPALIAAKKRNLRGMTNSGMNVNVSGDGRSIEASASGSSIAKGGLPGWGCSRSRYAGALMKKEQDRTQNRSDMLSQSHEMSVEQQEESAKNNEEIIGQIKQEAKAVQDLTGTAAVMAKGAGAKGDDFMKRPKKRSRSMLQMRSLLDPEFMKERDKKQKAFSRTMLG